MSKCFKMCEGEVFEKSACQDGGWTIDLTDVKCPRDIFVEGDVDALSVVIIICSVIGLSGLLSFLVISKILLQALSKNTECLISMKTSSHS